MLRPVKLAALRALRSSGFFRLTANSKWRQQRLLILCYHGIALEDEHQWRPGLYMRPATFERRLELLKQGRYSVLPLDQALHQLAAGTLPPRSVVLTFDDGTYDFYFHVLPLLKRFGFPATVYQTTYYTLCERPVFNLICSYMLWKKRSEPFQNGSELGLKEPMNLRTEAGRHKVVRGLIDIAESQDMSGLQKDELAGRLAQLLNIDYEDLKAKRIVQLMNAREVAQVARNGVDVQLHTHRHRTPNSEELFLREIEDNRSYIRELIGTHPFHFCYPGGVHRPEFIPWLRKGGVASATTCDVRLATRHSVSLSLPRFVDTENRTELEFESWLTGVGDLLAVRRSASQVYVPAQH
jgi:peptidoglycan/xylan/chitin deacetylase (PgdA/CDA1 family)